MGRIKLPRLEREIYRQQKNSIYQLLEKEIELDFTIVEEGNYFSIIRSGETTYYLTLKKEQYPEDKEYILVADKKPTEARLSTNTLRLKWERHPKLINHTLSEVVNSWRDDFHFIEEDQDIDINGLRLPQISSIYSILSHLKVSDTLASVVMPTGTGKTETMLSVLIANRCEKLLVTVPSDALRTQIYEKFFTLGLLKDFGIVGETSLYPIVGVIKQKFNTIAELEMFFSQCNVIVTTMSIVAGSPLDQQKKITQMCSHYFIDEAHHVKAQSWDSFRKQFEDKKVIQFTATPFRNDRKRLDGKIIFNFPLKKAQEEGYFKQIDFLPIRVYDPEESDIRIAEMAVQKLREDIADGYPHILMARCRDKKRADKIFQLYEVHDDLSPVVIHTGVKGRNTVLKAIKNKEHKIIVCVDMLGEGFDLPELKIAAFHDIKKSLPITLQFAGRFTRTRHDEELGNASFIVNLADTEVVEELNELYSQDADWNLLLSSLSDEEIEEKLEYAEFISGFQNLENSSIPFQNIRIPMSSVVYKNHSLGWHPDNFEYGFNNYDNYEYKFHDYNEQHKLLVVITAEQSFLEWGDIKDIYHLVWNITVAYYDEEKKLLFIHGSDKSGLYRNLATALIGDDSELISGINIFKAFHNIKRVKLQNVGLKEFLSKHIRFRMSVGSDIAESLTLAEQQRAQKAFVFGSGFENGSKVSLGCSYKGRIWSYMKGDLRQFIEWNKKLSRKLSDPAIDPNQVLRDTLIPTLITERPPVYPMWIDWDEEVYVYKETKYSFIINSISYDFFNSELQICDPSVDGGLFFELVTEDRKIKFELTLFETTKEDGTIMEDFSINNLSGIDVSVSYGTTTISIEDYFKRYTPTIWFADGSSLTGNEFVTLKQIISPYPREHLIDDWDWTGVDLAKEAQKVSPIITDSIQYKVIERLKQEDFDVIYDDDGSGEIADIVTIKLEEKKIKINLYHLKYASGGVVSNRIGNFYEVCGQAQKSIHWKHKDGNEFINHLLRRERKKWGGAECSRLVDGFGTIEELEKLLIIMKKQIPVEYVNYIVQPGVSSQNISDEILTLLGVTENYLMEFAGIPLKVVVNNV